MKKRYAVIVAGGQGIRMKGVLPKQFLDLAGKPVLMHTLQQFHRPGVEIILVLKAEYHTYWKDQCNELKFHVPFVLVNGGETRAESVYNGLKIIPPGSIVAVHDAVRPILSAAFIHRLFTAAEEYGSAVPVIPLRESLRVITSSGSRTVPRDQYLSVQTPQVFDTDKLRQAFDKGGFEKFTDEASLFEASGAGTIHLEPGEESNIKITIPQDLILAEFLLRSV